jgi:signal transduction histidine kinase
MVPMFARWLQYLDGHPRTRDAALSAFWLITGLALLQFHGFHLWSITAVFPTAGGMFLVTLVVMVALCTQRSSRPFLMLFLGAIVALGDLMFGGSIGVILVFTDLIYAAFKYGSDRGVRVILWLMVGVAILTVATLTVWQPANATLLSIVISQWALIIFVAAMWGWNVRSEHIRTRALMAQDHAVSLQRLRRRIAHDLHDLVANQIAVAGLHVEAAKLEIAQAQLSASGLHRSLEQASRGTDEADQQLRRMILVLSAVDDLDEHAEVPVDALVDECVDGLAAQMPGPRALVWSGSGASGLRAGLANSPTARARAILRVVQELVANAVKHGRGDVRIFVDASQGITVRVTNDIAQGTRSQRGSGIGIRGAALLLEGTGARLDSQAREADQGWSATLCAPAGVKQTERSSDE